MTRNSPSTPDARALSLQANARLRDAQRKLTELRYQRESGLLINIDDATRIWGDIINGLQILVRSYPTRARAALQHLSREDFAVLQQIAHDLLAELAAKADPPTIPSPSRKRRDGRADERPDRLDAADDQ